MVRHLGPWEACWAGHACMQEVVWGEAGLGLRQAEKGAVTVVWAGAGPRGRAGGCPGGRGTGLVVGVQAPEGGCCFGGSSDGGGYREVRAALLALPRICLAFWN